MNFARKAIAVNEKDAIAPINVVTATYLDPRRYNKFVKVWSFLATLGLFQLVQYQWVKSRSKAWKMRLKQWKDQMSGIPETNPDYIYQWLPYREDYLPQSVDCLLQNFAQGKQSIPLTIMGASYIKHVNVVFDDADTTINPMQIARNDGEVEYPPDKVASEMVAALNKNFQEMKSTNYRIIEASLKPSWRSRFIRAPDRLPTEEEMRHVLGEDYDSKNPVREFEDEGEESDEFQGYELEQFVNEIEPHIDSLPSSQFDQAQRDRYILEDIEEDRKNIIRQAILNIRSQKDKTR